MLLPISMQPSQVPTTPGSGEVNTTDDASAADQNEVNGVSAVQETSSADASNETSTGTGQSAGSGANGTGRTASEEDSRQDSDAEAAPTTRITNSDAAGPVPYVAPPTVGADVVAEAISAAEARAKLDADMSEAAADAADQEITQIAQERAANIETMASIVPSPENAPSLKAGVEALRAQEQVSDAQPPEPKAPETNETPDAA